MGFIVKDLAPRFGEEAYYVGDRKIVDPQGRPCAAADFGDKSHAKQFSHKADANDFAKRLNTMARREQFVVEEVSIYNMSYSRPNYAASPNNGFEGYGGLPPRRK